MPTNGNSFKKDEITGYLEPTHNTGSTPFGVESKKRFLALIEESGSLSEVCDVLGISTRTYYQHMQLDEAFARDFAIAVRRMASKLEGTMFKNGQRPQGYMDRITWLRRWFPQEWTPKSQVVVNQADSSVAALFDSLKAEGKAFDAELVTPQDGQSPSQTAENQGV